MKPDQELARLVAEVCKGTPGAQASLESHVGDTAEPVVAWRMTAVRFGAAGRYKHASERAIDLQGGETQVSPDDRTFLDDLLLQAGDIVTAQAVLDRLKLAPALASQRRFGEAAQHYRTILDSLPNNIFALDGLARAAGWSGAFEEAGTAGKRSLLLKDHHVCKQERHWTFPSELSSAFDPSQPDRNLIAYSLWGNQPRYIDTLSHNVEIAREIYPGWRAGSTVTAPKQRRP